MPRRKSGSRSIGKRGVLPRDSVTATLAPISSSGTTRSLRSAADSCDAGIIARGAASGGAPRRVDGVAQGLRGGASGGGEIGSGAGVDDGAGGTDEEAAAIAVDAGADGRFEIAALRADAGEQDRQIGAAPADLPQFVRIGRADDEAGVCRGIGRPSLN